MVFSIEHSRTAYWADFAVYGLTVLGLAVCLPLFGPRQQWTSLAALLVTGAMGWTLIEYGMHRYVLHGLEPFRTWHARHHERPRALISAPTVLSAVLIATFVFLPGLLLADRWRATALTLGLTAGYLVYSVTHHATHHWRADSIWLKQRKFWHAKHHHSLRPSCYGVSCSFWDHVFGSTGRDGDSA